MWRTITLIILSVLAFIGMGLTGVGQSQDNPYSPLQTPRSSPAGVTIVSVEPGDHLWGISAEYLAEHLERQALNKEIDPLWREVVATNRESLRSGDPDLIYPGELVVLPAIPSD